MARGGPRAGAGRKPQLDAMTRLAIGGHYERLRREMIDAALDMKFSRDHESTIEVWEEARQHRKKGQPLDPEHSANVEIALTQDRGINIDLARALDSGLAEHERPSRLETVSVRTPKGIGIPLMKKVAEAETKKRGTKITHRQVREYWKEFQRLNQKLDEDV